MVRLQHWQHLGELFETGPEYGFNIANPVERQLAWLGELRPAYVISYPGTFEEWMLAAGDPPVPLAIVEVDEISASPTGKVLDFISELHTDPEITGNPRA